MQGATLVSLVWQTANPLCCGNNKVIQFIHNNCKQTIMEHSKWYYLKLKLEPAKGHKNVLSEANINE